MIGRHWAVALGAAIALSMIATATGAAAGKPTKRHKVRPPVGTVQTATGTFSYASTVDIQPDGKLVVAGAAGKGRSVHALVVRYLTNGRIDPAFGKVRVFGGVPSGASDVVVQPDGKILVSAGVKGSGPSADGFSADFGLVRLLPSGVLDAGFGTGGMTRVDLGADDTPADMTRLPDGRILLVGASDYGYPDGANADSRLASARFTADGSLDSSWGGGGRVVTTFGRFTFGLAAHVTPTGTTTVAGYHQQDPGSLGVDDIAMARYDGAGAPDGSFGTAGKLLVPLASASSAGGGRIAEGTVSAETFGTDGRLLVNGGVTVSRNRHLLDQSWFRRFDVNGSPDPTLAGDGIAAFRSGRLGIANTLEVSPTGSILLGGVGSGRSGRVFQLSRLDPAGSIDRSFGRRGNLVTDFPSQNDEVVDLAVDGAGRVVAVGIADTRRGARFALARYLPNGKPDKGFGPRRHKGKRR